MSRPGVGGANALAVASETLVRGLVSEVPSRFAHLGVLGIRARLEWGGGAKDFIDQKSGRKVHVEICRSPLAVRAALLARPAADWLVVVTECDHEDLGLGITSRMIGQRLRTADPWEPVKTSFAANRIEYRLDAQGREVAVGLLNAVPPQGWPAAPAGVLTLDHAFAAVAAGVGLTASDAAPAPIDALSVLAWSAATGSAASISDLRSRSGDALADALQQWAASRAGAISGCWAALIWDGRTSDLVPMGLVTTVVLGTSVGSGPRALLRREVGADLPVDSVLATWGDQAREVTTRLLSEDSAAAARVLARADQLVGALEAAPHVAASDVLDRALIERCAGLGGALRAAAEGIEDSPDVERALVSQKDLNAVEAAWAEVDRHILSNRRRFVARAEAGVRLVRWLASPATVWPTPVHRHRADDAWVDRAVASAWLGVEEQRLATGLRAVLTATRARRDAHDLSFATALRSSGAKWDHPDVLPIEDVLATTVLSVAATETPVLLIVADGMSAANAVQITERIVGTYNGWLEYLPSGRSSPLSAVAALPTVTNVSRASLFAGEITSGDQTREQSAFQALCRSRNIGAKLLHKRPLDSSDGGFVLPADVLEHIDRTSVFPLVACVLNTIDDALDRSDPGGTEWTEDTVKHLGPLLDRALRAGRSVVLTSDHGHIIERRDGRIAPGSLSPTNRWRPASGPPAGPGEVLVTGERVVATGGSAILAVDETLRYSAMKAGYHGGGAPAEVVIPIVLLAAGSAHPSWRLAPPQTPQWWTTARSAETPRFLTASANFASREREAPTLFDDVPPAESVASTDVAAAVLNSAIFAEQKRRATRLNLDSAQIGSLLRACLAAGGAINELSASRALNVAAVQLAGAIGQVQRVLNVEQYPVLTRDAVRREVVLDENLLREQFGVGT